MFVGAKRQSERQVSYLRALLIAGLGWLPLPVAAETYLLMAEEHGCVWCALWDEEIAEIYPKTAEGQAAPLRRYNIHGEDPEGVEFATAVYFTPTFVLVRDGHELGRIEGYPGADFFWGLLAMMLDEAEIQYDETG